MENLPIKSVLITGATGNVGLEVIRFLRTLHPEIAVTAGVRDVNKAAGVLAEFAGTDLMPFDFEAAAPDEQSLAGFDCVFLLRPPHISDTDTYFKPLIARFTASGIRRIVFLSVQGAEKSRVIPHHRIEKLIVDSGMSYVFLRPSYFMQNLTTTLLPDIRHQNRILLPAGSAKFNWIDVTNIGEAAAALIAGFDRYHNQAIELTGSEKLNFQTVADILSEVLDRPIRYLSLNPFRFYREKRSVGMAKGMIMVMILLHFLPRFQAEPRISQHFQALTHRSPITFREFAVRERLKW